MSSYNDPDRMWARACEMLDRAERLQRQFFQPSVAAGQRAAWEPPIDLFETEEALWVVVALPGVDPQAVELVLDGGDLMVVGVRALPAELRGAVIRRMEIPAGRFQRRIPLPPGRFQLLQRSFSHGCLVVGLQRL
jgi:HSP20 family molecular chaperone IbpA